MVKRLFGPRCLVGVDVGSQAVRVIEMRAAPGSQFAIVGIGSAPTPEGTFDQGQVQDPERLGAAIREALTRAKIRHRRAALAVPSQVGFVRRIAFPPMPLKELRAAIDLQPERYLPFPLEGAVYDLFPLPADPEAEEQPVVLAAAPRQAVERLMEAAGAAGLNPVRIDVEPLSLFRAAVATGQAARTASTGMIDIGQRSTKISLFEGDVPVLSRVVETPLDAGPNAESTRALFWDIRRSLEFSLAQLSVPLSRVLVTGGVGSDDSLALSLATYLRPLLVNRLSGDFRVEPLRDEMGMVPLTHMLAFGLSLPPEMCT